MSRPSSPARRPQAGRGALSSPSRRRERQTATAVDDGWCVEEKEPDPVGTGAKPGESAGTRGEPRDLPFGPYARPGSGSCLSGDTPILVADGRTRTLAALKVGDAIFGTVGEGAQRRYVKTQVLARWSVIKPALRILLEDGTEIVAGGEHRLLTTRGWKGVAGGQGTDGLPHLTSGDRLLGTGAFARSPAQDLEYRRGYLCGLFRGYVSPEPRTRIRGRVRRVQRDPAPLIPCGGEAWERAERWLHEWPSEAAPVPLAMASGSDRRVRPLRAPVACAHQEEIQDAIRWPATASPVWCAGFLAGVFDAAGSYDGGALRICHPDVAVIGRVGEALRLLGIARGLELVAQGERAPIAAVRVLGGLAEHLRFFHSCDPASTARRDISQQPVTCGARLAVVAIEPLRVGRRLHAITTGTGDFIANGVVSHNCDARPGDGRPGRHRRRGP